MSAILQGDVGLDEAQERLVHDRGGLQACDSPRSPFM